jgi:hypothetical protein
MMRTATLMSRVPPTLRNDLFFEEPQQLALQRGRQIADLVEEHRAAIGQLEQAASCAPCASVKAPRSCPNSSDSSNVSVNAVQVMF